MGVAVCTPCVLWALLYAPRVFCKGGCMHPVCLAGGWLYAPRVSYGAGCLGHPTIDQTVPLCHGDAAEAHEGLPSLVDE